MSKDRELSRGLDLTVVGLATILHDEARSIEELAIRLDRLRLRRAMGTPLLLVMAATIGSLFAYMMVRSTNEVLDIALDVTLAFVGVLIAFLIVLISRNATVRVHRLESELSSSLNNLKTLVEKIGQFEEFRDLPKFEKFVVDLRLAEADKVLRNSRRLLGRSTTELATERDA